MGIKKPLIAEIAKDTYLVNEFGLNNMYILVGSKRSLVVDTGMGYCDFKELVESLTGKPYDIVITHGHPDHAGMMHQFDQVYMNNKDVPGLDRFFSRPFDMDEFNRNNRLHIGNSDIWDVTEDMINKGDKKTTILPLKEDDVFDLGNRKVKAFEFPGHTPGCMYFVDDGSRIAFTGDCCNYNLSTCVPVSTTIRNLIRVRDGLGRRYDRIFTGHSTYCGSLDIKSMDPAVLDNLIEAYRSLLRGNGQLGWHSMQLFPELPPKQVVLYGPVMPYPHENATGPMAIAGYDPELLWEPEEEQIIP